MTEVLLKETIVILVLDMPIEQDVVSIQQKRTIIQWDSYDTIDVHKKQKRT